MKQIRAVGGIVGGGKGSGLCGRGRTMRKNGR